MAEFDALSGYFIGGTEEIQDKSRSGESTCRVKTPN
jgi:hypothetical protein